MGIRQLPLSPAFAFWIRHTEALDALYELEDEDPEAERSDFDRALLSVWDDPTHREHLTTIFRALESDRDALLDACSERLLETFGRARSPAKLQARRRTDPWSRSFYLSPRRRELRNGKIWLSTTLGTAGRNDQVLRTSVWAKGGQATARVFTETFVGAHTRREHTDEGWLSGSAILSWIEFSDPALRDESGTAIDLNKVFQRHAFDLEQQTNEVLKRVLDALT